MSIGWNHSVFFLSGVAEKEYKFLIKCSLWSMQTSLAIYTLAYIYVLALKCEQLGTLAFISTECVFSLLIETLAIR